MGEEKKDVKQEEPTPTPVPEEKVEAPVVSEDVKTPEVETVDKTVYEKVREAMRTEREEKKAVKSQNEELLTRISALEAKQADDYLEEEDQSTATQADPRLEIVYLMNKDKFVKDNLDLIEQKMSDNPRMDVHVATLSVKAELLDRIQKEEPTLSDNKLPKQEKPTATGEPQPKTGISTDPKEVLKDALAGKLDIDPGQLEAIKRTLGR